MCNFFQINGYKSSTEAYVSAYTITNTSYKQIGTSSFNANDKSPAMVGYMFNKVYNRKNVEFETTNYKFGNSFVYDENTNEYTLSGEIKTIYDNRQVFDLLSNAHYTCWNTSGVCNTISYIYSYGLASNYRTLVFSYIDIDNGKSVSDALVEMLSANDVNKYNSSIKGIIDAWYAQNLSNKTSMLEDTVYCNSRDITNYGDWNPDGRTDYVYGIRFVEEYDNTLACPSVTNQFSISNNKAKLKYPVGLITIDEFFSYTNHSLLKSEYFWTLSPCTFDGYGANHFIDSYGTSEAWENEYNLGIRLTITLASNTLITGGTGSENDPWLVE